MSLESPQRLGDYLLIERIGEGGMAEVFRAQYGGEEHSVGPMSQVVVKRIKPALFKQPEFPIFREMFLNEAKLVRSLHHPNLARVYALLEAVDDDLGVKVPFIVGEYIKGSQLWELMRIATRGFTGRGVPVEIATYLGREIARGLGHAHSNKDAASGRAQPIIHRDISPENVMISSDGHVKVIDFGVAKALGGFGPQTRTGIIKGKLAYMAPEQVAQKVVPATDVFGAGIVLHELLTGRRLFGGTNDFIVVSRVLKAEIPRPGTLVSGIPRELDDVVMRALNRDLKVRYADGNVLADALTAVMNRLPEMRGLAGPPGAGAAAVRQWSKQVILEGQRIAASWEEHESEVPVDVSQTLDRVKHAGGSDEPIEELSGEDLMFAQLDGEVDPGVRAVVTQSLKTLRPEMLLRAPASSPAVSTNTPPPLPGARVTPPGLPVPTPTPTPAPPPPSQPHAVVAAPRGSQPVAQIQPIQAIQPIQPGAPEKSPSGPQPQAGRRPTPSQQAATRVSPPPGELRLGMVQTSDPSLNGELRSSDPRLPTAGAAKASDPRMSPAQPLEARGSDAHGSIESLLRSSMDLVLPLSLRSLLRDPVFGKWVLAICVLALMALVLLLILLAR